MWNLGRILDNKRCPNCGQRAAWQKIVFATSSMTYDPWRCPRCNATIGYNNRRINVMLFVGFGSLMGCVALSLLFWPFDKYSRAGMLVGLTIFASFIVWARCAIELKNETGE